MALYFEGRVLKRINKNALLQTVFSEIFLTGMYSKVIKNTRTTQQKEKITNKHS